MDVSATVSFQDAPLNSSLFVAVIVAHSNPQQLVPGFVTTASPFTCLNQGGLQALCVAKLPSSSGSESVQFKIGGIFGGGQLAVGTWALNVTAGMLDANNNLIPSSVSSAAFGVEITPLSLTVNVPSQVTVTFDGVSQNAGPVSLGAAAGSHNISVSPLARVNDNTRLRFDTWSDGFTEPNRTITLQSSSIIEAAYVTQYRLSVTNAVNVTGEGWYDANSSATFATNQIQPMTGILGLLGGKLTFQGWYENGAEVANSTSGAVNMDQPHALTVNWQPDYSMPITIIAVLALVVVGVFIATTLMLRKRATGVSRSVRGARRSRAQRSKRSIRISNKSRRVSK